MTPDVDWTNSSRDLSDNLDGHSIEELSDYLDSGRTPRNRSIEASPGCQSALQAMERLRDLAGQLALADTSPWLGRARPVI